jgi:hypothetical protein
MTDPNMIDMLERRETDRVAAVLIDHNAKLESHDRRISIIETEFHSAAAWAKWFAGAGVAMLAGIFATGLLKL